MEDRTNTLIQRDLPKLNDALRGHGIEEITVAAADIEGARAAALQALESGEERGAVATLRAERD